MLRLFNIINLCTFCHITLYESMSLFIELLTRYIIEKLRGKIKNHLNIKKGLSNKK